MRKLAFMLLTGFTVLTAGIAVDVAFGPADAQGFCRELRNACLFGPRGLGSCERYRNSSCNERREERIREREGGGGGGMSRRCERLQRSCEMKDRLGEQGQGNCRRFREECGGRR